MAGFDGISSTNSGALPELILASYRAIERGDAHAACELHRLWYGFRAIARMHGQPQAVKAAMSLRGFTGGYVRSPLRDLAGKALDDVHAAMHALANEPRSGVRLVA
jgi:4-hydroxy-tetrahydrodipicolinate synthase